MTFRGDNMTGVRKKNRSAVLNALQRSGGMSRKRLAEELGLTPAAITHITAELLSENLLAEGTPVKGDKAGRREVILKINGQAGAVLGVLINLREAVLSATDLDGNLLFSKKLTLELQASAEATVQQISRELPELLKENGISRSSVLGLGVAIRGILSEDERSVFNSFRALDQKNYPIAERFEKSLGFPTVIANNVRALFAAETFLRRSLGGAELFVRGEYGIGSALAVNGKIWRGVGGQCGEIGHIPVVPRGGKLCSCGKSGCLETISSPAAIREDALAACSKEKTPILYRTVQKKGADDVTLEDVLSAAQQGDGPVQDIVEYAVRVLSYALKAAIYLLDPDRITLYGRLFDDPYYLSRLMSEMSEGLDKAHRVTLEKSPFNRQLENLCAPLWFIRSFYENGGMKS